MSASPAEFPDEDLVGFHDIGHSRRPTFAGIKYVTKGMCRRRFRRQPNVIADTRQVRGTKKLVDRVVDDARGEILEALTFIGMRAIVRVQAWRAHKRFRWKVADAG